MATLTNAQKHDSGVNHVNPARHTVRESAAAPRPDRVSSGIGPMRPRKTSTGRHTPPETSDTPPTSRQ